MHVKPIDEAYKSARKYKCPYCDIRMTRADLINHVEEEHDMMIPEGYTANRVIYDSINGKNYNTCMICKQKVYEWDDKHSRYKNLCNKKSCRDEVRRIALERHMKTYNRPTLLDIPEWQADHMLPSQTDQVQTLEESFHCVCWPDAFYQRRRDWKNPKQPCSRRDCKPD